MHQRLDENPQAQITNQVLHNSTALDLLYTQNMQLFQPFNAPYLFKPCEDNRELDNRTCPNT